MQYDSLSAQHNAGVWLQVLISKNERLSASVADIVSAFLSGKALYTPASLVPQSVQTAVQQSFRYPVCSRSMHASAGSPGIA